MKLVLICVCCVLVQGCVAPVVKVNPEAQRLKIFENASLPKECKELATVEVKHGSGCGPYGYEGTEEGAMALFKSKVVQEGGNAAVVQTKVPPHAMPFCFVKEFGVRGFAFSCPPAVLK